MAYQRRGYSRKATAPVQKQPRFTPPGGWNPEFQRVFDFVVNGQGHGAIEAVAGGGKTTALVEAIIQLSEKNPTHKILFVAFNVSIKDEGQRRLAGYPVSVMTCHGLGHRTIMKPGAWGGSDGRAQFDLQDSKGAYMMSLAENELGFEKEKRDDREALLDLISKAKTRLVSDVDGMIDLMGQFGIDSSYPSEEFAQSALKIMAYNRDKPRMVQVEGRGRSKGRKFSKIALTFDDQCWLPIVNDWKVEQYDAVFVDEAQDLSPARREMIRKALKPGGRLFVVGDRYQCVDGETSINTIDGGIKAKDIKQGMKVLSWRNNAVVEQTVRHVQKSEWYCGYKIKTTSGKELLMSPNHKIWASELNKTINISNNFIKLIAHSNKNTTLFFEWSEEQFEIKDQLISAGLDVVQKDTKFQVHKCFHSYRDAIASAETIRHLVPNSYVSEKLHTPKECLNLLTASALHVGMRVAVIDGDSIVTEEIVSIEDTEGTFYDIDVDDASNFFGNGILSHNSIYAFAGADIDSLPMLIEEFECKELPLSCSWRCASNVVAEAQQFNPNITWAPNAEEGTVDTAKADDLLENLKAGDVLLSRTNAPLIRIFFQLARRQVKVKFIGRDYGKMLAYRIRGWKFRHEAEVMKGHASGPFTGRLMLEFNNDWLNIQAKNRSKAEEDDEDCSDGINDRMRDEHATVESLTIELNNDLDSPESVMEVLERCNAFSPEEKPEDSTGKEYITLSTTHRFKGLERDHAHVLVDTYKPGKDQEETNLLYVAITRAKKTLTYVQGKPGASSVEEEAA
jgi:superfamily I DNA and RNA helicase